MPIIDISMLEGRSDETKAEIIKEITDAFCRVTGNAPDSVKVLLRDVPHANWGAAGMPKEKP